MKQSLSYLYKRLLGKEFYTYSSEESLEALRDKLKYVFDRRWFDVNAGLYGEFVTDYEFYVSRKSTLLLTQHARTQIAGLVYLRNDRTYIDIVVKPAPQLFAFVLFFALLASVMAGMWIYRDVGSYAGALLNALGILLFSTILIGFAGMVLKDMLRWKFARIFRLKLVKNYLQAMQ
jgi:hypothetical protein